MDGNLSGDSTLIYFVIVITEIATPAWSQYCTMARCLTVTLLRGSEQRDDVDNAVHSATNFCYMYTPIRGRPRSRESRYCPSHHRSEVRGCWASYLRATSEP